MLSFLSQTTRRRFLARLGGSGAALALGAELPAMPTAPGDWDLSWVERVRQAKHRAVFDGPQGDQALMLGARYLENARDALGARPPEVVAVLNLRTRAVGLALNDAMWRKYPLGEEYDVKDPATGAPARRNTAATPAPDADPAVAAMTLERLRADGAIVLVCDFALGHLANRLATRAGSTRDAVHRELRSGFLPGAIAVPSGIFGLVTAQNAGCAFVPG